jgi:hypothetical protein
MRKTSREKEKQNGHKKEQNCCKEEGREKEGCKKENHEKESRKKEVGWHDPRQLAFPFFEAGFCGEFR